MTPSDHDDVIKATIAALSTPGDDALTKAAAEGIPDRAEVVEWVERTRALVLLERDRSVLRSELPYLAERLEKLVSKLALPDGARPRALVESFIRRLPAVRTLLAADVEAAYEGDPAAKSYALIVVTYPALHAIAVVSPITTPVPWSMKKRRPIFAPGWMSIPVRSCACSVIMRGRIGTPRIWSSCAMR